MADRIPVTVLGATGVVGQRFVRRLASHPWFEIRHLAASERSAGKTYREACGWRLDGAPYGGLGDRKLVASDPDAAPAPVVFSALDADAARDDRARVRGQGRRGCSRTRRRSAWTTDVPLLVPEVNADHLGTGRGAAQGERGWQRRDRREPELHRDGPRDWRSRRCTRHSASRPCS